MSVNGIFFQSDGQDRVLSEVRVWKEDGRGRVISSVPAARGRTLLGEAEF